MMPTVCYARKGPGWITPGLMVSLTWAQRVKAERMRKLEEERWFWGPGCSCSAAVGINSNNTEPQSSEVLLGGRDQIYSSSQILSQYPPLPIALSKIVEHTFCVYVLWTLDIINSHKKYQLFKKTSLSVLNGQQRCHIYNVWLTERTNMWIGLTFVHCTRVKIKPYFQHRCGVDLGSSSIIPSPSHMVKCCKL